MLSFCDTFWRNRRIFQTTQRASYSIVMGNSGKFPDAYSPFSLIPILPQIRWISILSCGNKNKNAA